MTDQSNARFESFTQHFWTEDNKDLFDYVLFLTNSSKKKPYTIDDSIFDWLFQIWEPNVFLVIGHEKMTIFHPGNNTNDLSDLSRIPNLELINCKDKGTQPANEVCEFIGSSKVGITDNLEDEDNNAQIVSLSTKNVQKAIEEILIVHEKSEQTRCRNASKIADRSIRKILEKNLVSILQDHEPIECSAFSRSIINDMNKPDMVGLSFSPNDVFPSFSPVIQCGRNITVEFPPKNTGSIPPNIINIAVSATIGIRFKSYNGAIGRTYLINATDEQKKAYKAVIKAREECLKSIKFGVTYSDIYNTFKKSLDQEYQEYVPESIGTFTGIQISTKYHQITEKSEEEVKPNTMLILIFGLNEYPANSDDPIMENKFSFQVTDTFQVGETEEDIKLLSSTSADFKGVAYALDITDSKKLQEELLNDNTNMAERTRHHNQSSNQKVDEESSKIFEELRQRRSSKREKAEDTADLDVVQYSYKNENDVHNLKGYTNQIGVAEEHTKTVFLPLYGVMVPFHVSKIKSAADENFNDKMSLLTVKFEVPKPDAKDINQNSIFIQEAQFITPGTKKFTSIAKKIRDLRTQFNQELKKQKNQKAVFRSTEKLEKLENNNFPRIGGGNLHVRPVLNGKKSVGNLEAHKNAFRFRSTLGDQLIIYYSNIRLAVFQRSRKETITLIHFYLNRPMMINNKLQFNITFYKQVVENAVDTSMRSSSMTDQGEMAEEEREARIRKKINDDFADFCKAVNDLSETYKDIKKFERPIRKLGFYGVPDKSRVFIMPTVNALVSVQEQPPYVLMIEDIQIAVFEHKDINMRTFDLTFILYGWEESDSSNAISQITTIDDEYFDQIKSWIEAIQIRYYVRKSNLSWKKLLPEMKKNKGDFQTAEDWDGFLIESESEDDEDNPENTDDQAFEENEEDEDDDDEEFDEDEPDTDEDDDAVPEDDDDSDVEASWAKQEEAALSYDSRHKNRFDDDDDDSSSRKKQKSDKSSKHEHHHHHHHSKH